MLRRPGIGVFSIVILAQTAHLAIAQDPNQSGAIKEIKRLQADNKKLLDTIKKQQIEIVQFRDKLAAAQQKAQQAAAIRAEYQARMRALTEQLRRMQLMLAQKGIVVGALPKPKPVPQKTITGKITKLDSKDKSLIQINIGTKQGLKLGQKLEVVRLKPQPVYLGEIRIVEVTPTNAVGRVVSRPGRRIPRLQVGDQVTNNLNNSPKK